MRNLATALLLSLTLPALLSGGCSKSEPAGDAPEAAKPSEVKDLPPLPEPQAEAEPATPEKPMARDTTDTAGSALGTLPKGIGVEPGTKLPELSLTTIEGEQVSLSSLVQGGPALVVFYRGGWCPYCNFQVQSLTRAFDQFKEREVTPVLISVDSADEAARTSATYEIPFPVLSDSDLAAHKAFNVAFEVDAETIEKYKGYGIDLEKASGKDHHNLAVPSAFLVDKDKKVLWAHADVDYKTRPSPAQLLAAIDSVLAE